MGDITAGHFLAGTIGAALLRQWYVDGDDNEARLAELRLIIDSLDDFPHSLRLNPERRDLTTGYAEWAATYDGPNPLVDAETPLVDAILADLAAPDVRALDAGCGTGRHASTLTGAGCEVIGIDASEAMLDVARANVPGATFEVAHHHSLPLDDRSIDLAVAALTLCHLPDPAPAVAELARVLRPGGTLVISDPHPAMASIGGQAFYGGISADRPMTWVENHYHGAATWLAAFRAAALEVVDCQEPPMTEGQIAASPATALYPDAARTLCSGRPGLWIWVVRRGDGD